MMSYCMNVLEVHEFATCEKGVDSKKICLWVSMVVSKHKGDSFMIFLLIEVSGHGLGFASVYATLLIRWNSCSLVHWEYSINLILKCQHDFNLICTSSWSNNFDQLWIVYRTCLKDLLALPSMI
jgi:hypothetical protein